MRIDEQNIQVQRRDKLAYPVSKPIDVATFSEYTRYLARLHARWNQVDLTQWWVFEAQIGAYLMGGLFNPALTPQVLVEGMVDVLWLKPEQNMNAWRLNIGVNDPDTATLRCQQGRDARRNV